MGTYHNTAIVFGSLKDALLHFEYVIPMNLTGQFMGLRPVPNQSSGLIERFKAPGMDDYSELQNSFGAPDAFLNLYPPRLVRDPVFKRAVNMFDGLLFAYMVKVSEGEEFFKKYHGQLAQVVGAKKPVDPDNFCPSIEGLKRLFTVLARDFQLDNIPIDCSHFFIDSESDPSRLDSLCTGEIRVIDTTKVRFPQIMEFRKDKETMNKMRNFRLFAYQEYSGKDRPYIEDDIEKRLSDYSAAVKASGFETTVETLSFLFESKLLMGAFATSAVALLIGNAQLAMDAFGAGAILQVGKLSLEYAKQRHTLAQICRQNPISYIADARERLKA